MAFSITDIKSQLEFGGARPALFQVRITFPNGLNLGNNGGSASRAGQKFGFMCKTASIPAQTTGVINVPYFGRQYKIQGNKTFEDWNVTIINDEDFLIRATMEEWHKAMNSHEGNLRSNGATAAPSSYKGTAEVWQYSKAEGTLPVRKYVFEGLFPAQLGAIDLNWETEGIEEFQVTFAYDYWEISTTETAPPTS